MIYFLKNHNQKDEKHVFILGEKTKFWCIHIAPEGKTMSLRQFSDEK